jgi:Na+/H+ antiporter NhaC
LIREGGKPMVGGAATELVASERVTPRAHRALGPLFVFIGVTLIEIARRGGAFALGPSELFSLEGMTQVLYGGSGSMPLMLGAIAGMTLAAIQAFAAGLRGEVPAAAWSSLRSMGVAIAILYLAWMMGQVCVDVGTAPYLTVLLTDALNPLLLPCILFVLSGVVAFATGSSWSTMTILLPLVVGLAFGLGNKVPLGGHALLILSIGAVLEGAIFGDHCSPISDTTVMSSIASASDHIDHVRTQAPYAILSMLVALGVGYFPCTFLGLNPFIALFSGFAVLTGFVFLVGRRVEAPA